MSHSISVIICKDQENLKSLFDKFYFYSVENGYAIISVDYEHPKIKKNNRCILSKNTLAKELKELGVTEYISAETDYIFGDGNQHCVYYNLDQLPQKFRKINQGLKLLKVRKKQSEIDLYDSISLSKYRDNHDLMPKNYKIKRDAEVKKIIDEEENVFYLKWLKEFEHLTEIEKIIKIQNFYDEGTGCFSSQEDKNKLYTFKKGLKIYVKKNS